MSCSCLVLTPSFSFSCFSPSFLSYFLFALALHFPSFLPLFPVLSIPSGTSIIQVTATDADDPTYGNSAKLVYTLVQGQQYFSVDPQTGECVYTSQNHAVCVCVYSCHYTHEWSNVKDAQMPGSEKKNTCAAQNQIYSRCWRANTPTV